ncbi:MAG: hypothetical protein FJW39_09695 [Acidobacteria bacterium]|nr:hypothetical protein [Acidobacteriota bacterium]
MIYLELVGFGALVPVVMFGIMMLGLVPVFAAVFGLPKILKREWTPPWYLVLIPAVLAQVWYAAWAVWRVGSAGGGALYGVAVAGMLIAGVVTDLALRKMGEAYKDYRISAAVTAVAVACFVVFLSAPDHARRPAEIWTLFLVGSLEAMFN